MIYSGDFGDLLDFVSGAKQYSFGPMGLDLFGSQLGKGHNREEIPFFPQMGRSTI